MGFFRGKFDPGSPKKIGAANWVAGNLVAANRAPTDWAHGKLGYGKLVSFSVASNKTRQINQTNIYFLQVFIAITTSLCEKRALTG